MIVGRVCLVIAVFLAACSAEAVTVDDPSTTLPTAAATQPAEHPMGAVLVKATGIVETDDEGSKRICPGPRDSCAGIPVVGYIVEPELDFPVVALTGWYDGNELLVTDSDLPDVDTETDFSTPCGDLQGAATINPPDKPLEAVRAYTETIPDRFAGMWWDRASAVMTVWLTGDGIEYHRRALEDAAGADLTVCVTGGAAYTEAALIEIQRAVFDVIDHQATGVWATSVGTLTNRVEVMMEYLDEPTRQAVADLFGDAVVFQAFLEVLEGTIADLPDQTPARPGNVELLTQPNRAAGGMEALGIFEVAFDHERGCVYFPGDESNPDGGGRIVPVWPFGYTAESDSLRIYDHNGELVAEEGDSIRMGGGHVEYVTEKELCGAGGAWIMSSRPEVIEP